MYIRFRIHTAYLLLICLFFCNLFYANPKETLIPGSLAYELIKKNVSFSRTKEAALGSGLVLIGVALIVTSVLCPKENCSGNGKGFSAITGAGAIMGGLPCLKNAIQTSSTSPSEDING